MADRGAWATRSRAHSISSVTYHLSHRSGSSLQASAVIIGGNDLLASVDISSLLPTSGYASVQATFANPAQLDPAATYFVAFCATGESDGQYNLPHLGEVTGFCYGSFSGCVSNESKLGLRK
jgi:hypothetical protein